MNKTDTSANGPDLTLNRLIDAPPSAVCAAWTTPHLLKQFFAPKPFLARVVS